jgi:hypothetical protein
MDNLMEQNKTRIIFNQRYKTFIKKLLDNNKSLIHELNSKDMNTLQDIQEQLREWIRLNQDDIDLCWTNQKIRKDANSMPDYFAIFISLLTDNIDNFYNWDDIYNYSKASIADTIAENRIDFTQNFNDENLDDDEIANFLGKCLCGHFCKFKNMAILENKQKHINLWIACDCAVKTGIINKNEFTKQVRLARQRINNHYLNQQKIKKLKETFRQCIDCNEYKILLTDPTYKIRCNYCYFKYKNKDQIQKQEQEHKCLLVIPKRISI